MAHTIKWFALMLVLGSAQAFALTSFSGYNQTSSSQTPNPAVTTSATAPQTQSSSSTPAQPTTTLQYLAQAQSSLQKTTPPAIVSQPAAATIQPAVVPQTVEKTDRAVLYYQQTNSLGTVKNFYIFDDQGSLKAVEEYKYHPKTNRLISIETAFYDPATRRISEIQVDSFASTGYLTEKRIYRSVDTWLRHMELFSVMSFSPKTGKMVSWYENSYKPGRTLLDKRTYLYPAGGVSPLDPVTAQSRERSDGDYLQLKNLPKSASPLKLAGMEFRYNLFLRDVPTLDSLCGNDACKGQIVTPTPPEIEGIVNGATVQGVIKIKPNLQLNPDISKVFYYVNGTQFGKYYEPPFELVIDTTQHANATYTLLMAYFTGTGEHSVEITFTINN